MVSYNTVHLIHNCPPLFTQGKLNLSITIAPYKLAFVISSLISSTLQVIRGMGHYRDTEPTVHSLSATEQTGLSVPLHCLIRGLPSEGYGTILAVETI